MMSCGFDENPGEKLSDTQYGWPLIRIPTNSFSTTAAIVAGIGRMNASAVLTSRSRLLLALLFLAGTNAWSTNTAPFFNVLDYGAHNDGSARSTEAIRSAIQAAHAAGGGTVCFPPGTYVTGPIELVNNSALNIDAGATLKFPATKLPFTKGRQQGIECLTPVPLIGGQNLQNVTITGRGVLTTNNAEWMRLMPRATFGQRSRLGQRTWLHTQFL